MNSRTLKYAATTVLFLLSAGSVQAVALLIAGSPEYDPNSRSGFKDAILPYLPSQSVNNSGTAIGYAMKTTGGINDGYRAVRWDGTGTATVLDNLGTDSSGATNAYAWRSTTRGRRGGVPGSTSVTHPKARVPCATTSAVRPLSSWAIWAQIAAVTRS